MLCQHGKGSVAEYWTGEKRHKLIGLGAVEVKPQT